MSRERAVRAGLVQRQTVVEGIRAGLGVQHLVARRAPDATSGTAAFHRVLGVRHLVQSALLLRAGSGNAHTLGAAIDAAHAVTMLPLVLLGGRWGRIGTRQFWLATGLAVAEVALVGTGRKR
ncbi:MULTISPECIES: hypothetical protein [unclassified Curtobacterium]|uniref:hypothetical protein n=1 Tax=unclassified Curtobacterium TaxID=257496 RepID=UPI00226B7C27|nr:MULTISPECIES: hypothetical protein [unclassified Curtobacterium]